MTKLSAFSEFIESTGPTILANGERVVRVYDHIATPAEQPHLVCVMRDTWYGETREYPSRFEVETVAVFDKREHDPVFFDFLECARGTIVSQDRYCVDPDLAVFKFYQYRAGKHYDAIKYAGVTPHYAWLARRNAA